MARSPSTPAKSMSEPAWPRPFARRQPKNWNPGRPFTVLEGDTALVPDHGGTGGSSGIPRGAADIRKVAATAHLALLDLGAKQLNRPASELTIEGGEVTHPGGQRMAVAALVAGKRLNLKGRSQGSAENHPAYTVVGKPILRSDVLASAPGSIHVCRIRLPGMLHGRVVRPPSVGAKLISVEESSIRDIPDVRVVRIESFLGVVFERRMGGRARREGTQGHSGATGRVCRAAKGFEHLSAAGARGSGSRRWRKKVTSTRASPQPRHS